MSKFSIILPVRNGGEYLKECVQSILLQTLPDFNLLVLDNNSTDGSLEWLESIKDERLQVLRSEKSLSIEENWNRAVKIPKNEFVTLIGHDDLLHPHYLATMQALIEANPTAGLYQAHFQYIDENGEPIRGCQPMKGFMTAAEFIQHECTQTLDSMGTGYMMRSADFDAAGGMGLEYPKLIFADYALWVKMCLKGGMAVSPVQAFSYRIQQHNVSKLTNGEEYMRAFLRYTDFLIELRRTESSIATVLDQYGHDFLMYFCESLSHRLLKTIPAERKTSVFSFILECRKKAKALIPGRSFHPLFRPGILAAVLLDNPPGIFLFHRLKRIKG